MNREAVPFESYDSSLWLSEVPYQK